MELNTSGANDEICIYFRMLKRFNELTLADIEKAKTLSIEMRELMEKNYIKPPEEITPIQNRVNEILKILKSMGIKVSRRFISEPPRPYRRGFCFNYSSMTSCPQSSFPCFLT